MIDSVVRRITQRALALIILGIPFSLTLAVVAPINIRNGIPVFFKQKRYGKNGQVFDIWKFQSMRNGNEPDEERVTNLGRFLRKSSLDELPQLINVLKGDIDFIGGRPLTDHRRDLWTGINRSTHCTNDLFNTYSDYVRYHRIMNEIKRIDDAKPGIFGVVQTSSLRGKYDTSNSDEFKKIIIKETAYLEKRKRGTLHAVWQDVVISAMIPSSLMKNTGHVARDKSQNKYTSASRQHLN